MIQDILAELASLPADTGQPESYARAGLFYWLVSLPDDKPAREAARLAAHEWPVRSGDSPVVRCFKSLLQETSHAPALTPVRRRRSASLRH